MTSRSLGGRGPGEGSSTWWCTRSCLRAALIKLPRSAAWLQACSGSCLEDCCWTPAVTLSGVSVIFLQLISLLENPVKPGGRRGEFSGQLAVLLPLIKALCAACSVMGTCELNAAYFTILVESALKDIKDPTVAWLSGGRNKSATPLYSPVCLALSAAHS